MVSDNFSWLSTKNLHEVACISGDKWLIAVRIIYKI